MKLNALVPVLAISSFAFATTPPYFTRASGIIINQNFEQAGDMEFTAGQLTGCQGSAAGDVAGYTCNVEGANMTTTQEVPKRLFQLTSKVEIGKLTEKTAGPFWYYRYTGTWQMPAKALVIKTRVDLTLRKFNSNPLRLRGALMLVDYSLREGVEAELIS